MSYDSTGEYLVYDSFDLMKARMDAKGGSYALWSIPSGPTDRVDPDLPGDGSYVLSGYATFYQLAIQVSQAYDDMEAARQSVLDNYIGSENTSPAYNSGLINIIINLEQGITSGLDRSGRITEDILRTARDIASTSQFINSTSGLRSITARLLSHMSDAGASLGTEDESGEFSFSSSNSIVKYLESTNFGWGDPTFTPNDLPASFGILAQAAGYTIPAKYLEV